MPPFPSVLLTITTIVTYILLESQPTYSIDLAESNVGCDNIPNSGLAFNDCGRCLNASLPNFANFGKDCEGVCDGMKESDECGQCLAVSSVDWDTCVGCDGIPFSNKSFNECGRCIDTNDVNFDNYGKDCRGLCATNAEMYEFDECGQCLLPSESEFNHCCGGNTNKQFNICGLCLWANATDFAHRGTDCSGVCFGLYTIDACGQCLLSTDPMFDSDCNDMCGGNHAINECGQCIDAELSNFNDYGKDCTGTCGGHYAVNPCGYCKDTRLNGWATFGIDCRGTCAMELRTDECGQCLAESDPLWNACVGCDNIPNSGLAFNDCGRCLNASLPNFANFGKDCEGVCDGMKESDECGQCLEVSSVDWDNCVGCDGIPFSNKSFNECGRCIDTNDVNFFNDYGRDCTGECASSVATTHYIDECGQCLLPIDESWNNCAPTLYPIQAPTLPSNVPTMIQMPTQIPSILPTQSPSNTLATLSRTGLSISETYDIVLGGDFDDLVLYLDGNDIALSAFAQTVIEQLMGLPSNPFLAGLIVVIIKVEAGSIVIEYSLVSKDLRLINEARLNIDNSVDSVYVYNAHLSFHVLSNEKIDAPNGATDDDVQTRISLSLGEMIIIALLAVLIALLIIVSICCMRKHKYEKDKTYDIVNAEMAGIGHKQEESDETEAPMTQLATHLVVHH